METSSDEMNHIKEKESNQDLMRSSIKSLTDSLTRTNELLQKERDYSRKLEKEISDLKMSLLRQEMVNVISRNNEDPQWTENDADFRANANHSPGRLATSVEVLDNSDNSSSNSSAEEDMDDWTTQRTR